MNPLFFVPHLVTRLNIIKLNKSTIKGQSLAYCIDSSSCVSWISSCIRFISIISIPLRYCEESKVFLCNVSIYLERSFMEFLDTWSSDSCTYFSKNLSNLEVRFESSSWIELADDINSSISSSFHSFYSCLFSC